MRIICSGMPPLHAPPFEEIINESDILYNVCIVNFVLDVESPLSIRFGLNLRMQTLPIIRFMLANSKTMTYAPIHKIGSATKMVNYMQVYKQCVLTLCI